MPRDLSTVHFREPGGTLSGYAAITANLVPPFDDSRAAEPQSRGHETNNSYGAVRTLVPI